VTDDGWLVRLDRELRRRAVADDLAAQAVAETRAHLGESGAAAMAVFGLPEAYAAQLASSLAAGSPIPRPVSGPVRLAAVGVGKRYGRRWALRDANLTVRAGQAAAVVGANGSGKSTFLRICAGMLAADCGRVHVDGTIGLCPQYGGTMDFLRPQEHFTLVGVGRGMPPVAARRAGLAAAARLQWDAGEPTLARHLSGGTRQKLNLAMAVLGEPDILLLDEPYQGFDRGSYLDFWEQVWQWRSEGRAVVVVTHLLDHLDRVDSVLDLGARQTPR
jgi:ABC-2 type transport system ATP-binding protein